MLKKMIPLVAAAGLLGGLAGCYEPAEEPFEGGGGGAFEQEEGVYENEGVLEEEEGVYENEGVIE